MDERQRRIAELFEKGILINEDFLEKNLEGDVIEKIEAEQDLLVLNTDYVDIIRQQSSLVDWYEIDQYRVNAEIDRDDELYQTQLQQIHHSKLFLSTSLEITHQELSSLEVSLSEPTSTFVQHHSIQEKNILPQEDTLATQLGNHAVTILVSFENKSHKYAVHDFTSFFLSRYKFLENILRSRQELQGVTTINRVLAKKERETTTIIGIVDSIETTKNDNLVITVEDNTGRIKVLVTKSKKEIYKLAKDLVHDEVIGIIGQSYDKAIFAENIIWPDVPSTHELKKGETEEFAIFLSDIHVGSTLFLKEEFTRFIHWIRGEAGSDQQRDVSSKVKYIIIAGDLVDGVGIYPSQEEELEIKDIVGQYTELCRLIKQIPSDKKIIICPGNHDVVHLAEPQSVFYKEYTADLTSIPNITLVTNPSLVNIGKTDTFSGFDVLLYHGYSFDYYVANVESIRLGGGYHRADLIMKFLLKRRHLAPAFRSTPYFPAHTDDPLIIKKVPDFLITGHIHYSCVANYKGVTMISGSCWQGKTSFQEKLGHEPEPARVPIVNLKTREVKILRFM